jgi:uncharacterized protein YdaU (DUF1376 family)
MRGNHNKRTKKSKKKQESKKKTNNNNEMREVTQRQRSATAAAMTGNKPKDILQGQAFLDFHRLHGIECTLKTETDMRG